ncbi:hypothetical protein BK709_19060 [Bacillus thuringiensis serovar shandongiensis]|nr:hypothetical protein BK717_04470 [Bacillus thuringiensis serovar malayensis]OUB04984.1 hypothetical protein BK709_19060 [Bacillus thuringiensis serovar shandongiensis]
MNYYQVNVDYVEDDWKFTTEQCFPMDGNPMLVQSKFKKLVRQQLEEATQDIDEVEVLGVRTRRVTKKHYEQNKDLKIHEGGEYDGE